MTPSEILASLAPGSARRRDAARELLRLLNEIAARRLRDRTSARIETFSIPVDERSEIVARVALKIVEGSPLPVAAKSDGECANYLETMLLNAWRDEVRRTSRLILDESPEVPARGGVQIEPPVDVDNVVARARAMLAHLFEKLISLRQERYHDGLRRAMRQVEALVFETATMNDVLEKDEGVASGAEPGKRKAATDRVLKAHQRLREGLLAAAAALENDGVFDGETHAEARRIVALLYRCQRSPGSRVSPTETEV